VAFAAKEARGLPFTAVDCEFMQTVALWAAKTIEQIEVDRALRESEHRYRSLVENAPFGLVLHDGETVLYCNPGFSELVGGSPAEVINKSIWRFIPEEDRPVVEARINGVIEHSKKARFLRERLVRLDGQTVDVAVLGVPVQYLGRLTAQALVIRETSLDEFDA
jgi:PAS domain S-box-containing protein